MHRALPAILPRAVLAALSVVGCRGETPATAPPTAPPATAAPADGWLRDVTAESGIDFLHQDGRSGEKYYLETGGAGGALLDVDADGDLDVFLVNGAATPGSRLAAPPSDRLYLNQGGLRFLDATASSGVADQAFGMGVCAGDVDGDGRVDLLVTNFGHNRLLRNLGGGHFADWSDRLPAGEPVWSSSCAFGDLDGDADHDAYVTHYVDFDFARNPFCGDRARNLRTYCRPDAFAGVTDALLINQDGRFSDDAQRRGLATGATEKGFGVLLADLDDDGDLDVWVANDGTMNRLYANRGDGSFEDRSLLSGTGYNARGQAESSMGVDAGDVDGDGRLDLVTTNYSMETNTLYRNRGNLAFDDATLPSRFGAPSYKLVGWGVALLDLDNDVDLDAVVANGHALDNIEQFEGTLRYHQPMLVLLNDGKGRFVDATREAGPAASRPRVSRGLAVGDLDDDGRLDLLVVNTNDGVTLLRNEVETSNHWLGVRLTGPAGNRLALGARVEVTSPGHRQLREVRSGGSFQSQSDLRLHFGLGPHAGPVDVAIRWPDGRRQHRRIEAVDRYVDLAYAPDAAP